MEQKKEPWHKSASVKTKLNTVGGVCRDLVDGNILVRQYIRRQYVLLLIIVGMCILYIGNGYTCDLAVRNQRELVKDIQDKRFELLSVTAELTENSRGSVVEDSVSAKIPELEVSRVPAVIIEAEK